MEDLPGAMDDREAKERERGVEVSEREGESQGNLCRQRDLKQKIIDFLFI